MPNFMQDGSDWLMARLKADVGTAVELRRGASRTTGVTATVGSSDHNQIDELGGLIYWESRDYMIDATDYTFGDRVSEPSHGDVIVETVNNVSTEYEVMGRDGDVAWRWSDDYHTKYRIHTQRIGSG